MKLKYAKRAAEKASETKRIRREGNIPASIYVKGKNAETIAVNGSELQAIMRGIQPGRLATARFTLVDEKGKERHAIIKDIQYNIINYNVIHLDFEELLDNVKINVKVPIECIGVNDCIGIKLGGVLRQVIRSIKVRCLPKDIPANFLIDVKDLGQMQSKRLSDLDIPKTVRPIANMNEVAVVIVKR